MSLGASALDWIRAVGQVAGALGTLAAVAVALWVARRDGQRLRAEQADRDASQARLVTADVHREDGRWWVRTTNHSSAPVYSVEVVAARHARDAGESAVEAVPGAPAVLDALAAGETRDRALADGGGDPSDGLVVLRYVDSAGLRWQRAGAAQPERLLG
jgi:hypothetical protein